MGPEARMPVVVPRRPEPVAPVGTAFAIALPSNGWLATDNPRTPLVLGRSITVDPVGNLLILPPLPNLTWLATDNPRTRLVLGRSTPNDPVGPAIPLPGPLGPYWFVDLPARARSASPRVQPTDPIGLAVAQLSSIGWLSPFEAPRSPMARPRALPTDAHLTALAFGGAPWADLQILPGRVAAVRMPGESAPVGAAMANAPLSGLGWMPVERLPVPKAVTRNQEASVPIGPALANSPLSSIAWQVVELRRAPATGSSQPLPTDAHLSALQFGGTPWAGVRRQSVSRPQEAAAPIGQAFAGALSGLGWLVTDAPRARLSFAQPAAIAPVGAFMPPPVLPSMGFQTAVDLPPKWQFISRPVPSEPIGIAFSTVPAPLIWPTAVAEHAQRPVMIGDTRRKR